MKWHRSERADRRRKQDRPKRWATKIYSRNWRKRGTGRGSYVIERSSSPRVPERIEEVTDYQHVSTRILWFNSISTRYDYTSTLRTSFHVTDAWTYFHPNHFSMLLSSIFKDAIFEEARNSRYLLRYFLNRFELPNTTYSNSARLVDRNENLTTPYLQFQNT